MIEKMILEVLDNPLCVRLIVDTKLPSLCNNLSDMIEELGNGEDISDTIYYMIDRSPDQGGIVSDMWHVSNSCGGGFEIPSHSLLLSFVEQIVRRCPKSEIWVESY